MHETQDNKEEYIQYWTKALKLGEQMSWSEVPRSHYTNVGVFNTCGCDGTDDKPFDDCPPM